MNYVIISWYSDSGSPSVQLAQNVADMTKIVMDLSRNMADVSVYACSEDAFVHVAGKNIISK